MISGALVGMVCELWIVMGDKILLDPRAELDVIGIEDDASDVPLFVSVVAMTRIAPLRNEEDGDQ